MPSSQLPGSTAVAAETTSLWPRRRRRLTWARALRASVPYWLILPVVGAVGAILAYPLYKVVTLSMILGTLIALLLVRVSAFMRVLLTAGLVLVWSMPVVVAVQVWFWITNFQNGVLNYVLTQLLPGDFFQHDWYETPFSQLSLVTALIVWGAIPFVVVTVYAGLSQVPDELVEAAEIDGARPWRVFLDVTVPILKPIFLILTSLSIIWDFGVFTQPFLLIGQSNINPSNYLMSIYLFEEGYFKNDYGRGAAISILMLLCVAVLSIFYVRRMIRIGDVR